MLMITIFLSCNSAIRTDPTLVGVCRYGTFLIPYEMEQEDLHLDLLLTWFPQ